MSICARAVRWALLWVAVIELAGCVQLGRVHLAQQIGESVVFVGEEPAALSRLPVGQTPIFVRSTYEVETKTIQYLPGRDYELDRSAGTLRRTPGSRIPDFRTNSLFGIDDFDHSKFPGFGNLGFFAFVDYTYEPLIPWPVQPNQVEKLPRFRGKLARGETVRMIAFGDSITAGGDVSRPGLSFWQRWAGALERRWPHARVDALNGATGGDSTVQGLQRLSAKVLQLQPDLVLVGFGMNDHNLGGVPVDQFRANLEEMVRRIRADTQAEVILFSSFPPNPRWHYGSHRMEAYAAATAAAAQATHCAYADVYTNWQTVVARKKCEDVLGNNINHPNDFGHGIYFQVFEALGL